MADEASLICLGKMPIIHSIIARGVIMSLILLSFIPTWLVFAVACISPGPNTVLVMSIALNSRIAAFWVCVGLSIGGFIWAFLSLAGVSQLLVQYPQMLQVIAALGASYLIYLGCKTLYSVYKKRRAAKLTGDSTLAAIEGSTLSLTPQIAIRKGLITTLSNPKVALVWLSLSAVVPVDAEQLMWLVVYCSVIAGIVFSVYACVGLLFSRSGYQKLYLKNAHVFDSVFATVFLSLGLMMIYTHVLN